MAAGRPRSGHSGERLAAMFEELELTPMQKELLRERWLTQVTWMSRQAARAHARYLWVRIPVVVGGALIPAFITILLGSGALERVPWLFNVPVEVIKLLSFVVSLSVAILAALEDVLKYGDRWRHYRRTAELLKTLGWQYLTLSGVFRRSASHAAAFASFTERIEDVLNEDVEGYLGTMASDLDRPRKEVVA